MLDPSGSSDGSDSEMEVTMETVQQMEEKASMGADGPGELCRGAVEEVASKGQPIVLEEFPASPQVDGLLEEDPTVEREPRTFSKEEDVENRVSKRKLAAQCRVLAKSFFDNLEAVTGGFSLRPDDAVVVGAVKKALDELIGQRLEQQLYAVEDDLRRIGDMPQELTSGLKLGVVVGCLKLSKTLDVMAYEQTVSNKRNGKKRSAEDASFKDNRLGGMEAAVKRVKSELLEVVGDQGLELSWFDAPRNLEHMTLEDVEAFKSFFEESLGEFEADPDLQGQNVKEKFVKMLHSVDDKNLMDSVFQKKFGQGYDYAWGDHLVYKRLVKEDWLRLMKAA